MTPKANPEAELKYSFQVKIVPSQNKLFFSFIPLIKRKRQQIIVTWRHDTKSPIMGILFFFFIKHD